MNTQFSPPATASAPEGRITLDVGTVHVWSARLDPPASQLPQLERLLSSSERARARRLRIDRDREQFVVRRGLLRTILGRYLGIAPKELAFERGLYGKLALDSRTADGSLSFNLSYSHGLALYAVARDQEVGVDVERLRDRLLHVELAERYFSAPERAELRGLPGDSTARGFFNGWTRKEAYIKALGTGLFTRLDSFAITLTPGEPVKLVSPHAPARRGARPWTLASLDSIPGYAAALTVAGEYDRMVLRPWPSAADTGQGANV
jgi:4'-phosphopantetheinyl transferase